MPIVTTQETSDLRVPAIVRIRLAQTEVDGEGGIGYLEEFFGRITKLATTERAGRVFQVTLPRQLNEHIQYNSRSSVHA
jgi:hypothetical protein